MNGRALIYGTIAIDTLLTPSGQADRVPGGSGPYAALAARLVTDRLDLVGVVGDDYPDAFRERFEAQGVSFRHVSRIPGKTFAWAARYEQDMNQRQSLSTEEGVQEVWRMDLPPSLRTPSVAVACNVTPRLQTVMLEQCSAAGFTMADFMESWILRERAYVDALLARVDLALMNDSEACCFAGTGDVPAAGLRLLEAGPRYAIVKHGSAGSTLFQRASDGSVHLFRLPAWPLLHTEDPTGAGDAYMGALAGWLTCCPHPEAPSLPDLRRGMALATIVAAATCESFGPDGLLALTREEMMQRLHRFHDMTNWEL